MRLPTSWKAAMVSGLVIALIGAALGGYIGLGGRLPGLARDSGGTVIALPDGASIHIPSKAVEGKPKVVARVVAPEDMPPLPDWVEGAPVLYEFTVDRPLRGAAELRIPLPRDADLALLSHYHDGSWKPVPFRIEGKMAVAEVTQLSLFGFLVVGYDKLERWLQGHPLINWALGGGTQAAGSPCEREAPGVTVRVDGTPRAVSACAQSGIGGTEVVVRNDRRFYLDVYPARGDLQWARGGLPWSCCDGRILPPEGRAAWLWRAPDGEAVLEARFTVQAAAWTIARLLLAPIGPWAWGDSAGEDVIQLLQEAARHVSTLDAFTNIMLQLMSGGADYGVVARELARFFSNPDMLAGALESLLQKGILARGGIYATSGAVGTLVRIPSVAGEIRSAADLVLGVLGGGVAALVTALPSGRVSVPPPASIPAGKIAFWSDRDGGGLYLMDADGRNVVKVAQSYPGQSLLWRPWAAISPDGTYVAHVGECPGLPDPRFAPLVVQRLDGAARKVIDDEYIRCYTEGYPCGFDWSPDGTKIVFCQWSGELIIAGPDGSGRTQLGKGVFPAWSPRGDVIAFSLINTITEAEPARCGIYTIRPDGTDRRLLTEVLCPSQGGLLLIPPRPAWSPDGSFLVFAAATRVGSPRDPWDLKESDVFLMRADGSGLTNVTKDAAIDQGPVWVDCRTPTAGCEARVTNVQPQKLNVREDPGTKGKVIGQLSEGDAVCVVSWPVYVDGHLWWPISSRGGIAGWAAARDPAHPDIRWLTPTGQTCSHGL